MMFSDDKEFRLVVSDEAKKSLQCLADIQYNASVKKGGENTQGGRYKYFRLEDINNAIVSFLKKHNCVVIFSTSRSSVESGFTKLQMGRDATPRDRLITSAYCTGCCRLMCIDNPRDYVENFGYGFKVDMVSDKSAGANTIMRRYLLMNLFNFESEGDDPDSDDSDVRRHFQQQSSDVGSLLGQPEPKAAKSVSSLFS